MAAVMDAHPGIAHAFAFLLTFYFLFYFFRDRHVPVRDLASANVATCSWRDTTLGFDREPPLKTFRA
jgi:hypothetical protein